MGAQRRKSVESHRGIAAGVRAGVEDFDTIAACQVQRQLIRSFFVENISAVTGRPSQHYGARSSQAGRTDPILMLSSSVSAKPPNFPTSR